MSFAEYADGLQLPWKHANYCCYYASMPIIIDIFLSYDYACMPILCIALCYSECGMAEQLNHGLLQIFHWTNAYSKCCISSFCVSNVIPLSS
jgi:hypothetical protein